MSAGRLDAWADAIDVSTDDEAQSWLSAHSNLAFELRDGAHHLASALTDVPDDEEVGIAARAAAAHLQAVVEGLVEVKQAFGRHERGTR